MNILYFVHGFPPSIGAGAINAYKIVTYLAKFGHKILILSPGVFSKISPIKNMDNLSTLNVNIKYSSKFMKIPLNLIFSHFENMAKFLIKLKKKFNPDVVLSQYHAYHYASVIGGYISKILKIPHIIRSHDIFFDTEDYNLPLKIFHSLTYPIIYRSILNCDIFYVTTTEMKKHFLKFKKLRKLEFKIHHNGVDINQFYPFKNQEELKDKYGCDKILLFIGTLAKNYGLQNLIKTLPEITKNYKDTHFLIIGEGAYKYNILDFIRKEKLTNQIHFLGSKPHEKIPFFINNCDIGIGLLSKNKSLEYTIPVKCLEYMACKKTFITSPISNDVIKNNDIGLVLNRNFTKKDILKNLTSLMEDSTLRRKLGENGLKKINQKFSWEKIMNKFNQELIKSVFSK